MIEDIYKIKRAREGIEVKFYNRVGTSDIKAIDEVFKKNKYRRKSFQIDRGDVWVDGGSNVGAFTVLALKAGAKKVIAIEADSSNVIQASRNISMNCEEDYTVIHGAICAPDSTEEHLDLYIEPKPERARRHSVYNRSGRSFLRVDRVKAIPLNQRFIDEHGIDSLKLNIEGAEYDVLRGDIPKGIKKIVFEWSFDIFPDVSIFWSLIDNISRQGYSIDMDRKVQGSGDYSFWPKNTFVYAKKEGVLNG